MRGVLEFLTAFYWLLLPETIFGGLRRANWRRAYAQHGAAGLVLETAETLIGTNSCALFVQADGRWDGASIAEILRQHGIHLWGWAFHNDEFYFHVRREDAWAAQRILWQAGVELLA